MTRNEIVKAFAEFKGSVKENSVELPEILGDVIPKVLIISGTVSTNAFTAADGQPSLADAAAIIAAGGFVYLKYVDSDKDVYEMIISCNAGTPSAATKNLTWSAA